MLWREGEAPSEPRGSFALATLPFATLPFASCTSKFWEGRSLSDGEGDCCFEASDKVKLPLNTAHGTRNAI